MEKMEEHFRPKIENGSLGQPNKKTSLSEQSIQQVSLKMHVLSLELDVKERTAKEKPEGSSVGKVQKLTSRLTSSISEESPVVLHAASPSLCPQQTEAEWSSFAHVTCNMPDTAAVIAAHGRDEEIRELCSHLAAPNWSSIIASYRGQAPLMLERDALKAFSQGKIEVEQYCSLAYLATLIRMYPDEEISIRPLFNREGEEDPLAKEMMKQGLHAKGANFFTKKEAHALYREFFENMQYSMPSEQYFFYIPFTTPSRSAAPSIRDIAEDKIGLRVFDCFVSSGQTFRMIPTFSMIHALCRAYGKENAVDPAPMGGPATRKDLRLDIDKDTRVLAVPLSDYPSPTKADGFECDPLDFIRHDVYHILTSSRVPKICRQQVGELADLTALIESRIAFQEPLNTAYLETFYGRMVDVDFMTFRAGHRAMLGVPDDLKLGELFLLELEVQAFEITKQRMLLKINTLPAHEKRATLSPSSLASLEKWDLLRDRVQALIVTQKENREFQGEEAAFNEIFEEIYATSGFTENLAKSLFKNKFLKKFNISSENLRHVQTLAAQFTFISLASQRALLSTQLLHLLSREEKT